MVSTESWNHLARRFHSAEDAREKAVAERDAARQSLDAIGLLLDPDADHYDHDEVMKQIRFGNECGDALQTIATALGHDPEGYLPDEADRVLGRLREVEEERDAAREQLADLLSEATLALDYLDQIRKVWGDEAVLRRRADQLRSAIKKATEVASA